MFVCMQVRLQRCPTCHQYNCINYAIVVFPKKKSCKATHHSVFELTAVGWGVAERGLSTSLGIPKRPFKLVLYCRNANHRMVERKIIFITYGS